MKQIFLFPLTIVLDLLSLMLSLFLAVLLRLKGVPGAALTYNYITPFIFVFIFSLFIFYIGGLYDRKQFLIRREIFTRLFYANIIIAIFIVSLFYFVSFWGITPKTILFLYIILSGIILFIWRGFLFQIIFKSFAKNRAVLVSKKEDSKLLSDVLIKNSPHSLFIEKVFFTDDKKDIEKEIKDFLEEKKIQTVIIQNEEESHNQNSSLVYFLASMGINIYFFDDVYESIYGRVLEKNLYSKSLITYLYSKSDYYDFLKRLMDIFISLFVLFISLPLWFLAFILIKIETGGNVLLKNNIRIGRGGKKIKVYKFRTMRFDDTGVWVKEEGNKNTVTKVGYFLRKTRIDELPQLLNVLKGELSLIGPRPDIVDLGERLSKEIVFYKSRLVARPGLSGWAQIMMNKPPQSVEETKERLLYDLYYIKHRSFTLDLAIALKTIKTLLSREGV